MSDPAMIAGPARAARQRRVGIAVLFAVGWIAVLAAIGWRWRGGVGLSVALAIAIVATLVTAVCWTRRIDASWLARRLDARRADMDDSAALLFRDEADLGPLQNLQRARLLQRLQATTPDLRDDWPWRAIAISTMAAAVLLIASLLLSMRSLSGFTADEGVANNAGGVHSTLDNVLLAIEPPAYTGLPARRESGLDGKAAQGSLLRWALRISPRPETASLSFHDGSRLPLTRDGDDWVGERRLDASFLYRLDLGSAAPLADQRLHRFDAVPDLAPEITVIEPERSLSLLAADQKTWPLRFEARDDHGLGAAVLQITLAQGGGENITFKEQSMTVPGVDLPRIDGAGGQARSYAIELDLGALGIAEGDDVIVRLAVSDNAQPTANITRSASFILRWPPEAATDTVGMEGIVQNTLPAYFRSQRQIIIDSEKLVAETPTLAADAALIRSDTIGVDQKILRLRYGQFLGEEFESGRSEAPAADDHAHDEHDKDEKKTDDDKQAAAQKESLAGDHDHAAKPVERFGDAGNVLAEFGHTHDHAEAATLLDPETRRILKAALDEMWQAELHLRQGAPALALPYEYRALGYIKQVQQASRIYLARVGLELPEVDETRRLTGKRDDVADRSEVLPAATADNAIVANTWTALDGPAAAAALDGLERWVRERKQRLPDALGVIAAIDSLRRDPACADCRERLRAQLWPLLPTAAARATPRVRGDAAADAWLDALPRSTLREAKP